ncbi:MAG: hypothetical protein U9Q63_03550 [Patescibacteria group bacterium]|nr:hypothetical protein [Patescibacteria group bacterium]
MAEKKHHHLTVEAQTYLAAQKANSDLRLAMDEFKGSPSGRAKARRAIRTAADIGDFREAMGFSRGESITSSKAVPLLRKVKPSRKKRKRRKKGGKRK